LRAGSRPCRLKKIRRLPLYIAALQGGLAMNEYPEQDWEAIEQLARQGRARQEAESKRYHSELEEIVKRQPNDFAD
jgi:hypothetical protein